MGRHPLLCVSRLLLLWAACGVLLRPAAEPARAEPAAAPDDEAETLKAEAVTTATQLAAEFPEDPFALALLGTTHYNLGNSAQAVACAKRCLELDPKFAYAYSMMAQVALDKGEPERVVALCRQALQIDPALADVHRRLGRALVDLGRAAELIAAMQQAIKACGRSAEFYYFLGQGHLQAKQYEKAADTFRIATEIDPGDLHAWFGLFTASARLGQQEKAAGYRAKFSQLEAAEQQAIAARGLRERALAGLELVQQSLAKTCAGAGQVYRKHGYYLRAERFLVKAAQLDPSNRPCREELVLLGRLRDRPDSTRKALEQLAEAQPDNEVNCFYLGAVYLDLGRHDAAEQVLRKALQLNPADPWGYNALADLFLTAGRQLPEALSLARKLVERAPTASHHFLLARACAANGDRAAALAAVRRAIELDPDRAEYERFRRQTDGGR